MIFRTKRKIVTLVILSFLLFQSALTLVINEGYTDHLDEDSEHEAEDYFVPGGIDVYSFGNFLYVLEYRKISIYQIENPNPPVLISQSYAENSSIFKSMRFYGNRLFILDQNSIIHIYDVSNATNISYLDYLDFSGNVITDFEIRGFNLFLIVNEMLFNLNIENLTNIELVYSYYYHPEYNFIDCCINGDYLYILDYELGMIILDLTNETMPEAIQIWYRESHYSKIAVDNNFIYFIEGKNIFTLVRKSSYFAIGVLSQFTLQISEVRDWGFISGYALFIGDDSLEIVRLLYTSSLTSYGKMLVDDAKTGLNAMKIVGSYAFIVRNYIDSKDVLIMYDITSPSNPEQIWPLFINPEKGTNTIKTILMLIGFTLLEFISLLCVVLFTLFFLNKQSHKEIIINKELEEKITEITKLEK
ncbi:MAG: hypothetical protein ACFFDW_13475 [Candidatus Thorarchaeota archaeon]